MKKGYLLLIVILCLFVISSVNAEGTDDGLSNDTDQLSVGIGEINEVNSTCQISDCEDCDDSSNESDEGLIASSNVDLEYETLGDDAEIPENKTFTELANKIFRAVIDDDATTIDLYDDYYLNDNFIYITDTSCNTGLNFWESVTINGNGHVIDGLSKSDIDITSRKGMVFNNVTFKNFITFRLKWTVGVVGAIELRTGNFSFVNCNFINVKATTGRDCAILSYNANSSSFINCTFINCSSNNNGGAIAFASPNNTSIVNCTFINCSSSRCGGAIWIENANISSIVNCSFINNFAEHSGGAVGLLTCNSSSILNCSFEKNHANGTDTGRVVDIIIDDEASQQVDVGSHGGAVYAHGIAAFLIDSCSFNDNLASGGAGAVFCYNISGQIRSSRFSKNSAFHGGTLICERSNFTFENLNISDSSSFNFGGAMASLSSDATVINCNFHDYKSERAAGGAIYNYKGSSKIINSSFSDGTNSVYGGAIANSQANLTILSSKFINNAASNGGAIYSVHGNVYINDSFFKNSRSTQGSAIYCMLSNSLVFTNNVFINNTGNQYNIYSIYSNRAIVESGNHFENTYHVKIEYGGVLNGRQFTSQSRILNYVVSNTGRFLDSYDFADSASSDGNQVNIDLFDSDYPQNSTIFGDYDTLFKTKFNFQRNYNITNEFKNYEFINVYLYDDADLNNTPERIQDFGSSFQISMNVSFANRTIFEYDDLIGVNGRYTAISLINSSQSNIADIPSYYDSRDFGYITSVRNQGDAGNCWAFAGLATLEACIKKATGITYDFSENNPKNLMAMDSTTGVNIETNTGGFDSVVMGYLTSWLGPISEKTDIYDAYSSLSPIFPSIFHVQNIYFLPARNNNLDNNLFKRAIMDYGAVSVTLKWSDDVYHAVSLIGWVDNYNDYDSLGNYARHAWIFKNSWGTDWDVDGYGYLSYDIPFLSDDAYSPYHAYTFIFDGYENYYKSYQYEYSGVNDYLVSEGPIYYSTKFVCNENSNYDEGLVAFSTFFKDPTSFTVSVYVNDRLVLSQNGHSEAGYYTIPFNQVIDLQNGDEFTIMIANRNSGLNYAPICRSDETTVANVRPNTSFVSFDGVNWHDLYDLKGPSEYFFKADQQSNTCQIACIKAFTSLYNAQILRLDVSQFNSIGLNETVTIDISLQGNQFNFDTLEVTNNTLVTLNINGKYYYAKLNDGEASINISFNDYGVYKLSAMYGNNLFSSNTVKFNFTIKKEGTVLSAKSMSKIYGGSEKSLITLKDGDGNLIKGALITFYLNGKQTVFKTNDQGQISVPISLVPSTYTATVTFAGDDVHSGTAMKVSITVKKANPKLTASKKTFKVKAKTKKYTITLKDNLGKAIKNAKVKIKVNKKTYTAKTNGKGKATFKITKLSKKGKFTATVIYAGSSCYNKLSKKVKITVK